MPARRMAAFTVHLPRSAEGAGRRESIMPAARGAVKGLRLSASIGPGPAGTRLLEEAGIDLQRDNVRIVRSPWRTSPNWAWDGVDARAGHLGRILRQRPAGADLGVKRGITKIPARRAPGRRAARGPPLDLPGARDHGATRRGASWSIRTSPQGPCEPS